MQTIENTTTIPAVRRVDEVVAKREAAAAFLAETINNRSRAEIGVLRSALGWGGTDASTIENAQYADGYDAEKFWFYGTTRRLSRGAIEKALRSLYRDGLIRIEGTAPMASDESRYSRSEWNSNRFCHVSTYRSSNSGIRLDDGRPYAFSDESGSGTMHPQQIAAWFGAWLLGNTEKNPMDYMYWQDLKCVRIVGAPELAEAMKTIEATHSVLVAASSASRQREGLAEIEVAERVKPDAHDIVNSVTRAFHQHWNAESDVETIWRAMDEALSAWRDDALYGSKPENSITPERYAARSAELTAEIEKINAKIEEVSR